MVKVDRLRERGGSVILIKKGLRFRNLDLCGVFLGDIDAVGIVRFTFMGSVAVLAK